MEGGIRKNNYKHVEYKTAGLICLNKKQRGKNLK